MWQIKSRKTGIYSSFLINFVWSWSIITAKTIIVPIITFCQNELTPSKIIPLLNTPITNATPYVELRKDDASGPNIPISKASLSEDGYTLKLYPQTIQYYKLYYFVTPKPQSNENTSDSYY